MTDLLTTWDVTECPTERKTTPAKPARPRLDSSNDHWSQRVADPLGAALKQIQEKNKSLDIVTAWATEVQPVPPTVANSVAEEPESAPSILPHPAVAQEVDSDSTKNAERRRFARRQSECSVSLVERHQVVDLTPRETDWLLRSSRDVGRLLDLSQTGVCLQLTHPVSVGSEVLLRISNELLNRHVDSAATVVHCQTIGPQQFSVHCQVLFDFTLDQLQDLGRPELPSHLLA